MFNQTSLYFERMMKSMGDKSRLIEHIPADSRNLVDVGGADGTFAKMLGQVFENVTVLDASEESCARAVINGVKAVHAYADELSTHFTDVDVVIASSVLHEIFSYGHEKAGLEPGRIASITRFLDESYEALKPGGRLLIRDGVRPVLTDGYVVMDKDLDKAEKFIAESPFMAPTDRDRSITLTVDHDRSAVIGDMGSVWEFVMTYTWGEASWTREISEFYGVFSGNELIDLARRAGFKALHFEAYVQPDYPKYLPHVHFFDAEGNPAEFPFTNAIWVFEK